MKRSVACAPRHLGTGDRHRDGKRQLGEGKPSLAPTPPMGWSSWKQRWAAPSMRMRSRGECRTRWWPPEWPRWDTPTSTSTTAGWPPQRDADGRFAGRPHALSQRHQGAQQTTCTPRGSSSASTRRQAPRRAKTCPAVSTTRTPTRRRSLPGELVCSSTTTATSQGRPAVRTVHRDGQGAGGQRPRQIVYSVCAWSEVQPWRLAGNTGGALLAQVRRHHRFMGRRRRHRRPPSRPGTVLTSERLERPRHARGGQRRNDPPTNIARTSAYGRC